MIKIRDSLVETQIKNKRADNRTNIIVIIIVSFLLFVCYLNVFVFMNVMVSGASMEQTLKDGDVVIVDRTDNKVKPGDIVVIKGVKEFWLIKRVIAVDKCTVELKEDGYVYVNGEKLEEEYLNGMKTTLYPYGDYEYFKWELKDGDIFYLGDNRWVSADSRQYGTCSKENIAGVVQKWSLLIKDGLGKIFVKISGAQ